MLLVRRSLIPILILVGAFAAAPPLLHRLLSPDVPVAKLVALNNDHPPTNFRFSDGSGRSLTLEDFRGTPILINVWATWCSPCREEMPSLNRLARLLRTRDVEIIPISIDVSGVRTVRPFYERLGLNNLKIYVDPSKSVLDAFGIVGIPTTVLIGRDGHELGRMIGPAQWDAPESVKHLAEIVVQHTSSIDR